jgi:ArsR family transcriptional regulator, arsenate/arsenite/antimonite-responsive transcriptional repressor
MLRFLPWLVTFEMSRNPDIYYYFVTFQDRPSMTEIFAMGIQPLAVVGHVGPDLSGQTMDEPHALAALAALGQATRLAIFRTLVRTEPNGMAAGALAEAVGCPHNTLSTHVAILARAGLVYGTRGGRTITYRANAEGTRALLAFLVTDCCQGRPELCGLSGQTSQGTCCPPSPMRNKRKQRKAAR